jgi:hypothetical protein
MANVAMRHLAQATFLDTVMSIFVVLSRHIVFIKQVIY